MMRVSIMKSSYDTFANNSDKNSRLRVIWGT